MRESKRKYPPLLSVLGIRLVDVEWGPRSLPKHIVARLRAQATELGRVILADWLTDQRARMAALLPEIQADLEWLGQEAARQWLVRDAAESARLATAMVERLAPAIQKAIDAEIKQLTAECRQLQKTIDRAIVRRERARFTRRRPR